MGFLILQAQPKTNSSPSVGWAGPGLSRLWALGPAQQITNFGFADCIMGHTNHWSHDHEAFATVHMSLPQACLLHYSPLYVPSPPLHAWLSLPFRSCRLLLHQENLSGIIASCGVYNWAANCDAVVTTAIQLESVCSFSWTDGTITNQPFCNGPTFCNSVWRAQFCLDPLTSLIWIFCLDVVFTCQNFSRFVIACRNWNVMIYIVKRWCLVLKAFGTVQHSMFCCHYIHSP